MNSRVRICFLLMLLSCTGFPISAATLYVDLNNSSPAFPYLSWATAATNIQTAIDAASPGDRVLVTDGVYKTGGRAVYGSLLNRVVINKAVLVQSVNGPAVTLIQGFQLPTTRVGDNAVRCVYLTNGATLAGFTLTNGATRAYGRGLFSEENCAGGVWCEPGSDILISNCFVSGNISSADAGGAFNGNFRDCSFIGNTTGYNGGGAWNSSLTNCVLTSNLATTGAGMWSCNAYNCTAVANFGLYAGAAYGGTLNNCALAMNVGTNGGGGTMNSTLNNCTIVGNTVLWSSPYGGGGSSGGSLNNCVLYYNSAPAGTGGNHSTNTLLHYCCTLPLPPSGTGNITNEPQLSGFSHLSAGSRCIAAGNSAYVSGFDIDGESWATTPSIGCDEVHLEALTGPLGVNIVADRTNVGTAFPINFVGNAIGRCSSSQWNFQDGTFETNRPFTSHSWVVPGDYAVTFTAFNDTHPLGVSTTQVVHVAGPYYVAAGNSSPVPPYSSWSSAATNIQDAIDVASFGGSVLVSNGVYQSGGRVTQGKALNRVAITKPVRVIAINGPTTTTILGDVEPHYAFGCRCAYLTNGATLAGFTLSGGSIGLGGDTKGGGVWAVSGDAVISNCVLTANIVVAAGEGGGVYGGTLINCLIVSNSTPNGNIVTPVGGGADTATLINCALIGNYTDGYGGGAEMCNLVNCTLSANHAGIGGGVGFSSVNNCIVYSNTCAPAYSTNENWIGGTFTASCTTPDPGGNGNITLDPLFVDFVGRDFHLQTNSPCINSGLNTYAPGTTDLGGNPRIVGGTIDIGAYEFQTPTSLISYAWLQNFSLAIDGSADFADPDHDHMNNWQEWRAGTDPTNSLSLLQMLQPIITNTPSAILISWQSVTNRTYFLQRATNLAPSEIFSTIQTNILGLPNTTSFTDTNALGPTLLFYRVGVQ